MQTYTLDDSRELVASSYKYAINKNKRKYCEGDPMATESYTYQNQMEDAHATIDLFYKNPQCRAISIKKNVKVGADGFMIELATKMCLYPDNEFTIMPENVYIITGMSNKAWQTELESKVPDCFKEQIFHHGKLQKAELSSFNNGLLIIDEIDTASQEEQKLHNILRETGLMDLDSIISRNIRIVFISATLAKELTQLKAWGDYHINYTLTTPETYAGIQYFMEKGIAQESYELNSEDSIARWIQEDIIDTYGNNYKVHLVRLPKGKKQRAAIEAFEKLASSKNIRFYLHTSDNKLTDSEFHKLFTNIHNTHCIIALKGLYRRATRIPDPYKLHIGAVHVSRGAVNDNNVIAQDLIGRMCGYIKLQLEAGHKLGPIRAPLKALREYVADFNNEKTNYQSSGFKKKATGEIIKLKPTMVNSKNIKNLEGATIEIHEPKKADPTDFEYELFDNDNDAIKFVEKKFRKRSRKCNPIKTLQQHGENPDLEYIITRKWGISSKISFRKVLLNNSKICVYWRPSLIFSTD